MNRLEFEARLNEVYNGAVKPINNYINERAVLCFKCEQCGVRFFGKPSYMIGKEHQRHLCDYPMADKNGERLHYASATKYKRKKKSNNAGDLFYQMVWEDYTPQEIAKELQVNPNIIKDYFKDEGLI